MKKLLRSMSHVLVPLGFVAAALAFFALFSARQPVIGQAPSGWGVLLQYEDTRRQEEMNTLQQRFHTGTLAIQQMKNSDGQAIHQAMVANSKRFTTDADAINLRWSQNVQRIQHNILLTSVLMATTCLLLFLSMCAFTAKFFSSQHFKQQHT